MATTLHPPNSEPSTPSRAPRWSDPFKVRSVWIPAVVLVVLLIVFMTVVYLGSVVNPTAHLHGLPVGLVDQDGGARPPARVGGQRVDFGQRLAAGLSGTPHLTRRLALHPSTLSAAKVRMGIGTEYAAVVIPRNFTRSLLAVAGVGRTGAKPSVELLTNPRAGTLGVSLATGVLEPALAHSSARVGDQLTRIGGGGARSTAGVYLSDPLNVSVVAYRPPPAGSALGLSAFYISLLITFCGFLGAMVVNTSIDAVLGYAPTEFGPVWRQRRPVPLSRWQTLLAKWLMAVGLSVVLTGLMLLTAVVILHMNAPHFGSLWLLAWFMASVIAIGTLVLFAALGTVGQLVALVVFVYLALASSGGTVPLEALPGFLRFVAGFEPLRQIFVGVRAILYFDARGAAGLTRAWIASGLGLVFWLVLGVLVTRCYDHRRLDRMPRELVAVVGSTQPGRGSGECPA